MRCHDQDEHNHLKSPKTVLSSSRYQSLNRGRDVENQVEIRVITLALIAKAMPRL